MFVFILQSVFKGKKRAPITIPELSLQIFTHIKYILSQLCVLTEMVNVVTTNWDSTP